MCVVVEVVDRRGVVEEMKENTRLAKYLFVHTYLYDKIYETELIGRQNGHHTR